MNPIDLASVRRSFGENHALRSADMVVEPGELVGLVGPNGSGKTTCLRIMIGIIKRDGGDVQMLGMDPARDSLRIRQHCSYLPGETSIYHGMRGSEFLHFALNFYPSLQDDMMEAMIETFGLPLSKKVHKYSAGMKQKLALMATLIPDVELYVLDEPDRALDATARFELRDLIQRLHAKGKTILLSSHHLREVEALASRQVFLMNGKTVDPGQVDAAHAELARRVRLTLAPDTELPDGATLVETLPDGVLQVEPHGDPLQWLTKIPSAKVVSAEFGTVRLEDLYRMLTEQPQDA